MKQRACRGGARRREAVGALDAVLVKALAQILEHRDGYGARTVRARVLAVVVACAFAAHKIMARSCMTHASDCNRSVAGACSAQAEAEQGQVMTVHDARSIWLTLLQSCKICLIYMLMQDL